MRIVHYMNQFFAGVGGEDMAMQQPFMELKPIGPGLFVQGLLEGQGAVEATVVCGDSYFAERPDEALARILELVVDQQPDLVIAGPAFGSGRYGVACASIASAVVGERIAPVMTGMHPENPGLRLVEQVAGWLYVVRTDVTARGMRDALARMMSLGKRVVLREEVGSAEDEGYLPFGARRNRFASASAAERAVRSLRAKVAGEAYRTEIPLPVYREVASSVLDVPLGEATLALVSEAGLVPRGNPDRLESNRASQWFTYSIEGAAGLASGDYITVHGGCDNSFMNEDPNRAIPLDAMRDLEAEGHFGTLHDRYYVTTGATMPVKEAERIGREIAADLRRQSIHAVLVTST